VYGATGLVGGALLDYLLASPAYTRVKVVARKSLGNAHPKLEAIQVDYAHLAEYAPVLRADDVFIALGTTMKKAGSKEAFRLVDYTYCLQAAQIAHSNAARQVLVVTALGADARSLFFYNRVKGELEAALEGLGLPALHIFQPSLLLGARGEKRWAEEMAQGIVPALGFVLQGSLRKYRAIRGQDVALAMVSIATQNKAGLHRYESDVIQDLADAYR
jgi:uncharacterized protein YbjT (DUF2867 family)